MRADIHHGPEHNALQAEAGYIDARPYLPDRRNLLQRAAGPYIRVNERTRSRGSALLTLIVIPAIFGLVKGFRLPLDNQECSWPAPGQGQTTSNKTDRAPTERSLPARPVF